MRLSDYDLVIFDCDGVLVDSERLTVGVEARLLTELGWPMTTEEVITRWVGRSGASQHAEIAERLGGEVADAFDVRIRAELEESFAADLEPVEGVHDLIAALLVHGLSDCVASSGSHNRMRRTLGLTGLWDHFEGRIYSASEVAHGKPAPDLFLHAAARSGVAPDRCVVVEDSAPGVRAAIAAGMAVVGYAGGVVDRASLEDAGAADVIMHLRELIPTA